MIPETKQQHQRFKIAVGFFFQEVQQLFYFFSVACLALLICRNQHNRSLKIQRGQVFFIITENGIGCFDELVNETVEDDYRIAFFREHIRSVGEAIADGVEVLGYYMWSPIDIVSCSSNQMSKRYGLIYVNLDDLGRGDGKRFCKKSFYWYQKLIATNGKSLNE